MSQRRTISPEHRRAAAELGAALGVSGDIHDDDYLYWFAHGKCEGSEEAVQAYLVGGQIHAAIFADLIKTHHKGGESFSLLDFAAGYGRVVRHFPALFPKAAIHASDIHPEALTFLSTLSATAHPSATAPDDFGLTETFDVVAVLSFFTHLPRHRWGAWLARLSRLLKPEGLLIFTAHGTRIWHEMSCPPLDPDGFQFYPVSEQADLDVAEYGNCVTTVDFVANVIRRHGLHLEAFHAAHLDSHDIYVVRNAAAGYAPPTREELIAARDRSRPFLERHAAVLLAKLANSWRPR